MKKTDAKEISPALLAYLQGFLKEERKARFEQVLASRTRHITCVLENIADAHNANAVMRSCECFGIQDVHIIENGAKFKPAKKVLKGSHKWLSVHKYREESHNTLRCIRTLKERGYRIVATSLEPGNKPFHEIDVRQPLALVFGQEHIGISDVVRDEADDFVIVPMTGFTESLNIAAAAAILLQHFTHRIHAHEGIGWQLDEDAKNELRKTWTLKSIYRNELLVERFYQDNP